MEYIGIHIREGIVSKIWLNLHTDWLKKTRDSRAANQNPAVPISNQSESDFKRYFGDDP